MTDRETNFVRPDIWIEGNSSEEGHWRLEPQGADPYWNTPPLGIWERIAVYAGLTYICLSCWLPIVLLTWWLLS